MPGTKIINHHAAGHAQDLSRLATSAYRGILKGEIPTTMTTEALLRYVNALRKELNHGVETYDPFLTEEPKDTGIDKLPTVKAPAVEAPKEPEPAKKRSFLGS